MMVHHTTSFYGVPHATVQQAIARAHRERSQWVWSQLHRLFGRSSATPATTLTMNVPTTPTPACLY